MVSRTKSIDGSLLKLKNEIEKYAIDYGLDFYPVIFEVCDYDTINILAALGGFPNRYPHWRFGMDYDQMYKGYAYGMQKIYEMVVNTNPCYAYLLNVNPEVDQKIVMAHVYGHADFFKNNAWFANSNRSMMDVMANHGTKIRRYMDRYGQDKVEDFIDKVLSLENLLDINILFELPKKKDKKGKFKRKGGKHEVVENGEDFHEGSSQALKSFMKSKQRYDDKKKTKKDEIEEDFSKAIDYRDLPSRDIMKFLLDYAPCEEWQSDLIGILREEAYYFLPQRLTKIINEGWASYWHSNIMTKKALKPSEVIHYADHHSGVMVMSKRRMNPYKIGLELLRDIEFRWDTGKFGKEYEECDDIVKKNKWDKKVGLGKEKIFNVRKTHNDVTFIDNFFTREFCERQQLFTYKYNPRTGRNEIDTRDFEAIKSKLLLQLTNFGSPVIEIEMANYNNRGELLLKHIHQGMNLDLDYAADTMKNIYAIWKRPINIATKMEGKDIVYVFDGKQMKVLE